MLNAMRRIASTWFGKVLGAFLIVGLAGFGISNVLLDLGSNAVAKVGSADISVRSFQRAYNQQLNTYAAQYGQLPTAQQAVVLGIPGATLGQLIADGAVEQTAVNLGLGASDPQIAKMLRQDRAFADILGGFDRSAFLQRLRQNGYTEAEYFDELMHTAQREQLTLGLFGGTPVTAAALDLINRYQSDLRTFEYITLAPDNIDVVPAPTEDDLTTYLTAHQADFRTSETRSADILVLSSDLVAAGKSFTDAEITAEYERTKASRIKLEKRTIQQIVLPNAATVTQFEAAKIGGVGFDAAAEAAGLTPVDLGTLTKSQITDPTLADAAFGLKEGEFAVIAGAVGKRAIRVSKVEAGGQISLEESRADIIKSLGLAAAKTELTDMLDQIEELRAAFKPLKDIADRFKLPLTSVTLNAGGAELSTVPAIAEPDRARVADAIFAADREKLAPMVSLSAGASAWFDLRTVDAARDQTLDEVRGAVTAAWTKEKTDAALAAEAKKITDQLDTGMTLPDIAAARGLIPSLSLQVTRRGDATTAPRVAAAIFAAAPDSHGSVIDADGNFVIFHVTSVEPGSPEGQKAIKPALEQQTRDSIYFDFVEGLRQTIGSKINQQALDKVLPTDENGL